MLDDKLKPLQGYLRRRNVVELQVNETGAIWVEIEGKPPVREKDPALTLEYFHGLARVISNMEGISDFWSKPHLAVMLPGGHRLQLCLGRSVTTGVAMSIRVWRPRRFELADFDLPPIGEDLVTRAIAEKWNVIVSGGTFSGKTQFLNACLAHVPGSDRVITIQDTPELDIGHVANKVEMVVNRLETDERIDYSAVIDACTRLRPDRIFCGELSVGNSHVVLRLLNSGHGGFWTTVHANDPDLALHAITRNIQMAGHPSHGVREFFEATIDLVVQVSRQRHTSRRFISAMWQPRLGPWSPDGAVKPPGDGGSPCLSAEEDNDLVLLEASE